MHSPYLTAPTPCAVYYMLLSYFLWALPCNSNPNCTLVKTQLPPLPAFTHTLYELQVLQTVSYWGELTDQHKAQLFCSELHP